MFSVPFKYHNMACKSGKSKPVTAECLKKKSKPSTVKPITKIDISKETQQEEYYRRYGIIYSGSDLQSCINSILN